MKCNKVIAVCLVLLMSIAFFSACGSKDNNTQPADTSNTTDNSTTTDLADSETNDTDTEHKPKDKYDWHPDLEPEPDAKLLLWESQGGEEEFTLAAMKRFNEIYPNIQLEFAPIGQTDSAAQLELDGPNGNGADVFAMAHDHLGRVIEAGLVLENDALSKDVYETNIINATSIGGKWYGYPTAVETYLMFYNKELVDTPPTTFQEVFDFAKTFNDPANNKFAFMFDVDDSYYTYAFLSAYGADLFGPKGDDPNQLGLDTQEAVDAMKFYQSIRDIYDVNAEDASLDMAVSSFTNDNCAFIITGPWTADTLRDAGCNFGIAPIPAVAEGKNPKPFSGVRANYINAYTKYPNASKILAAFLSSKEMIQLRIEMIDKVSPRKDIVPDNEFNKAIYDQFLSSHPMPSIPEMAAYWNAMAGCYANIWNGEDVVTELEGAAQAMRNAME